MDHERMLGEEKVGKLIVRMCIPAVVLMLVIVIYNVADIFFIGQTGDASKVAAIALTSPLYAILQAIGTLFGSGASTSMSISIGEKNYQKVKSISSFCCYITIALGILFAAVVLLFAAPISTALGSNQETQGYTITYITILSMGAPFILFGNVFGNIVRSDGAVKESLISNLMGSVINIILDPIFILGLNMGVAGAAVATVLGNVVASIYLLVVILKKPLFSLNIHDFSIKKEISWGTIALGIPMALSTLLMSFGDVFLNNMLNHYGEVAIAAFGVAGRITMILAMVAMGICMGIQPLMSYCYGARDYQRMKEVIWKVFLTNIVVTSLLTVICFVFRNQLLEAFVNDADVVTLGRRFLIAALLSGPFCGVYQLCSSFLQATAHVKAATFVACLKKGIVYIPAIFILYYVAKIDGLVYATPVVDYISIIVSVIISHYLFQQMKKKLKEEVQ
ncbi:MAG: MATE family efflux transporter [bacterium]|nr:MATE family efflux transporter [bacterium]